MTVPDDLLALEEVRSVEEVKEMQDDFADFVVLLCKPTIRGVRMEWLRRLRDDWNLTGTYADEVDGDGYVLFERKE